MLKKLLILMCVLLACCAALAEETPTPFTAYFDKPVFLRPEAQASSESLATIPAGTPIDLVPVDERFAQAVYAGRQGYVYYVEAKRLPETAAVEAYLAYLPQSKYLFAQPLDGAASLMTVAAETPVTVTGESGRFLRIESAGKTGYVYARDTEAIDDMHMEKSDAEFYAQAPVQTRIYPLKNAAAARALEPGRIYLAEAVCSGYYRVTVGEDTVYVPVKQVTTVSRRGATVRAAVITPETALFTRPEQSAATQQRMDTVCLMLLGPQISGFQQLGKEALYVRANDVTTYAVSPVEDTCLQMRADAPLLLRPEAGAEEVGCVRGGQLYEAAYAVEGWYLLQAEGAWGFMPRDDANAVVLEADLKMMRTAAVLTKAATLYDGGERIDLSEGARLLITQRAGDFYRCDAAGRSGYVPGEAVRILGADTPLTEYTIAAPAAVELLDFPDASLGSVAGVIPAGEKVRVTGFNRCYLMVTWKGLSGYARQAGLVTAESEGLPQTEDVPRYELVLDKSTGMCYAFLRTETGERGDVVICAEVGIGKRTTPTPSGTFLLGRKERWHAFTLSYTPHTTEYVRARYIHGWPCEQKRVSTVKESLVRTGTVTGGCLRSPFDFARWVYMNCTSYDTQLLVVSGGFEPPAGAAAVQVK